MIIESIEIENFMCYSEYNKFEFSEGMNVIIGDNGYGKSKLYDAFYWVMYDQCFDTNEKIWKNTRHLGKALISDKAVAEANDGLIRTSVKLTLKDIEKDCQYIVERILTAQKSDSEIIIDKESEEEITFRKISGMTGKVVSNPEEVERIKRKILPDNIRPYMWFQGEQVESIIDFGESDSLSRAINVLSNITRFDDIKEVAEGWAKSASDQYHRKVKALSSDKAKSDELEAEREKVSERIELLEKDLQECKNNLGYAEEEADKLVNKQEEATRIRELDAKRKALEAQLENLTDEEKIERIGLHQKMFSRRWVLKGTDHLVKAFNEKYSAYQDKRIRRRVEAKAKLEAEKSVLKELQTRLPINVPEPIYVQKMLDLKRCLVCDREAPEGSEAYLNIEKLLQRTDESSKIIEAQEPSINNFESEFRRLSQHGYAMEQDILRIDNDIAETFQRIQRIDKNRRSTRAELDKIQKEVENLVTESSIDPKRARHLLNELQANNDHALRFKGNLTRIEGQLEQRKNELKTIDDKLGALIGEELPTWLEEKKKLLEDFKTIASSTRDRVFRKLLNQLENEANRHYRDMMQGNLSAQGIIKLVESSKGNYMPRLVDQFGNPLMQLNTGNIILIKLATIMAIISARQGTRDTDLYTLITDAPMSVFGEDYTIGFCKTVSKVYRQSIIMSKEFYKNETLRRQLLNDADINLGKVYMITPSIEESERSNRNSLKTLIKALN